MPVPGPWYRALWLTGTPTGSGASVLLLITPTVCFQVFLRDQLQMGLKWF